MGRMPVTLTSKLGEIVDINPNWCQNTLITDDILKQLNLSSNENKVFLDFELTSTFSTMVKQDICTIKILGERQRW